MSSRQACFCKPRTLFSACILFLLPGKTFAHAFNASEPCEPGSFLDNAFGCLLCPAGKWSPQAGLTREEDCLPCPEGRICSFNGMTNVSAQSDPCFAGFICGVNTSAQN